MQKNRLAAVGAFVILGLLLFAVGLFLIGDRRMMFSDNFAVYAEFSEIAGLQNGAIVRVSGMNAGEVESIHLPASPSAKFRVKLRVREDLHQLIRLDSVASIQNDGLVGNKFVQVEAGTDASPKVEVNGTIGSREPFDLADMFERLNETIDLVTTTIKDVKAGVDDALKSVSATAADAQALIDDIGSGVRSITASSQKVTADLAVVIAGIREGRGSIGKLLKDDTFYVRAQTIAAEAEKAVRNLREASETAKSALNDFRGDKGPVKGVVGDFQQSLTSARETLSDLAETSEALKRNFLFRGFFNRRGYFDLDDISVADYRRGALETKDRKVLRIWVSAAVLFAKTPEGQEQLTDDGRARLDRAMATYVRYPRSTPFVIEGYAAGETRDVQFVLSRSRAQLVRDYVVAKFGLDAAHVAIMPLGADAPESPANGQWEGVALAAFVDLTGR